MPGRQTFVNHWVYVAAFALFITPPRTMFFSAPSMTQGRGDAWTERDSVSGSRMLSLFSPVWFGLDAVQL